MATRANKHERIYAIKKSEGHTGYERKRSDDLYHSSRWTRESKAFRVSNPLCCECKKNGRVVASQAVDHIIPYPVCNDFFDSSNWQALCNKCNAEKGNRDKRLINNYKKEKP